VGGSDGTSSAAVVAVFDQNGRSSSAAARRGPDGLEVRSQHRERGRIDRSGGPGRIMRRDLALDFRHMCERRVPSRLQLSRDEPVGRICGIILSEGAVG
jgi:hypothetical protein